MLYFDAISLPSTRRTSYISFPSNPSMASTYKRFINDLSIGPGPLSTLLALSLCFKMQWRKFFKSSGLLHCSCPCSSIYKQSGNERRQEIRTAPRFSGSFASCRRRTISWKTLHSFFSNFLCFGVRCLLVCVEGPQRRAKTVPMVHWLVATCPSVNCKYRFFEKLPVAFRGSLVKKRRERDCERKYNGKSRSIGVPD